MDLEACSRAIRLRYYQWALCDARREVEEDFPLIRQVRSPSTLIFLDMMAQLPKEKRLVIAEALVRRIHAEEAQASGQGLSSDEAAMIEAWVQARGARLAREGSLRSDELSDGKPFKTDRKRLATLARELLTPRCGAPDSWSGENAWRHQKAAGIWTLETVVDVGGRIHQLSYGHSITFGRDPILKHISLLAWLGVSGQTNWYLAGDSQELAAAKSLECICRHFVEGATSFVASVKG